MYETCKGHLAGVAGLECSQKILMMVDDRMGPWCGNRSPRHHFRRVLVSGGEDFTRTFHFCRHIAGLVNDITQRTPKVGR